MISGLLTTGAGLQTLEQQHNAGRLLLRRGLRCAFGLASPDLGIVENRFGKPLLREHPHIHFSISHSAGAVAVVVSDGPVGVDIERVRPRDPFAGRRMFHPIEIERVEQSADPDREFFRCWTLKESYVKALGVGLAYPVRTLVLTVGDDGESELNRPRAALSLNEECKGHVIATCRLRGLPGDPAPVFEHVHLPMCRDEE